MRDHRLYNFSFDFVCMVNERPALQSSRDFHFNESSEPYLVIISLFVIPNPVIPTTPSPQTTLKVLIDAQRQPNFTCPLSQPHFHLTPGSIYKPPASPAPSAPSFAHSQARSHHSHPSHSQDPTPSHSLTTAPTDALLSAYDPDSSV